MGWFWLLSRVGTSLLYHTGRTVALCLDGFEPLFEPLLEAGGPPPWRASPYAHRLVQGSWLGLSTIMLHDNFLTNLPEHTNTQQQ